MNRWAALLGVALLIQLACQPSPAPAPATPATQAPSAPAATAVPASGGAASATQAPAAAGALETVRVGILNNSADLPLFLAQERGYLRELGLEMTTQVFNGAQQMIAPLAADQLDAGGGAPGPGLFNAIQRGVNLRIVADRVRMIPGSRFNCLAIRKPLLDSGAVQSIADLRGRVFAENVPAVATTSVFDRELRRAGMTMDDVSTTVLSFPDMLSAFGNGAIDAAFLVEPFVTLAEERGLAECRYPIGDLMPDFQLAVLLYGPTFAETRPETARRFMVAYLRAVREQLRALFGDGQGREAVLETLAEVTGSRDMALLSRQAPAWQDPNGRVSIVSLAELQRWYVARGDVTTEMDLNRAINTSFADYAVTQLGPYHAP